MVHFIQYDLTTENDRERRFSDLIFVSQLSPLSIRLILLRQDSPGYPTPSSTIAILFPIDKIHISLISLNAIQNPS